MGGVWGGQAIPAFVIFVRCTAEPCWRVCMGRWLRAKGECSRRPVVLSPDKGQTSQLLQILVFSLTYWIRITGGGAWGIKKIPRWFQVCVHRTGSLCRAVVYTRQRHRRKSRGSEFEATVQCSLWEEWLNGLYERRISRTSQSWKSNKYLSYFRLGPNSKFSETTTCHPVTQRKAHFGRIIEVHIYQLSLTTQWASTI